MALLNLTLALALSLLFAGNESFFAQTKEHHFHCRSLCGLHHHDTLDASISTGILLTWAPQYTFRHTKPVSRTNTGESEAWGET